MTDITRPEPTGKIRRIVEVNVVLKIEHAGNFYDFTSESEGEKASVANRVRRALGRGLGPVGTDNTVVHGLSIESITTLPCDLIEALALLEEVAELYSEECRFDHDGNCQAHFLEANCMIGRIKEVIHVPEPGQDV